MDKCNDKKCRFYSEEDDDNCRGYSPATDCYKFKPLITKEAPMSVPLSVGLYGAVQWINDNPVLDGMPYFEDKEACLEYTCRMEARHTPPGISVRYTIIRLERAI